MAHTLQEKLAMASAARQPDSSSSDICRCFAAATTDRSRGIMPGSTQRAQDQVVPFEAEQRDGGKAEVAPPATVAA